jgi:hypothetical protein
MNPPEPSLFQSKLAFRPKRQSGEAPNIQGNTSLNITIQTEPDFGQHGSQAASLEHVKLMLLEAALEEAGF